MDAHARALSPTSMADTQANLLSAFSTQPEVVDPLSAQPLSEADAALAKNLAVHDAAVARVDAHARALSPTSMADTQANLLCAREAARADDRRIREQDHSARAAAVKLQDNLKAVRACQRAVFATQRALDLELVQVAAASEAASADAARIANACLLYTSPSPRDQRGSRMPSSA